MPLLSMETLKSSPDMNGNQHSLSIDSFKSKHSNVTTHEALIRSYNKYSDPRDRTIVLVKFPTGHSDISGQWAHNEQRGAQFGHDIALKFNMFIRQIARIKPQVDDLWQGRIKFLIPQSVPIDSGSRMNKKRKSGEWLVFEDMLESFTHFMDTVGKTLTSSQNRPKTALKTKKQASSGRFENIPRFKPVPIPANKDRESIIYNRCSGPIDTTDSPPSYDESQFQTELGRLVELYHRLHGFDSNPNSSDGVCLADPNLVAGIKDILSRQISTHNSCHRTSMSNNTESYVDCDFDDNGNCTISHPLLQAFVHFFFCHTGGEAVVCNLKGSCDEHLYTLTTPVIHSVDKRYGSRDRGLGAMREVISNHRCSWLCRSLPDMSAILRESSRRRGL